MQIEKIITGPLEENCYLVGCAETHQAALIDPGDDAVEILAAVEASGLTVTRILLTHAHFDHLSAVAAVQRASGAPVAVHSLEKYNIDNLALQTSMFGFPAPEPFAVASWLLGGEIIKIGKLSLKVLNAPGHSAGGICFYGHGQLFSGDVLFRNSIGRSDLPGGDPELLLRSIRTALFILPDETIVLPGHGGLSTIGHEKKYNPFLR